MAQEKIIIKFDAKGDERLIKSLNNLYLAQIRLEKGTKGYERELRKMAGSQHLVRQRMSANTKAGSVLQGTFATLRNKLLLFNFAMALGIRQLSKLFGSTIKTASQFENLNVRLTALYGSTLRGAKAFNTFNKVAATTPFMLENVVNAGAQLKAFGVNAEEMIKPVADLAAFMGLDIVDASNAMGRAFAGGAGAADILRERGILQLIKDSQGIRDLSKITLPEFREALIATLQDPLAGIAGSTDMLSRTYAGAMSNMQDSVARLSNEIGRKFLPLATTMANKLKSIADSSREFLVEFGEIPFHVAKSSTNIKLIEAKIKDLEQGIIDAGKETGTFNKILGVYDESLKKISPKFNVLREVMDMFNNANIDGAENIENVDVRIKILQNDIAVLTNRIKELQTVGKDIPTIIEEEITARQKLLGVLNEEQQKKLEIAQAGLAIGGEMLGQFTDMTSAMNAQINARMKNEIDTLKATSRYQKADAEGRKKMEEDVTRSVAAERTRIAEFEKAAAFAQAGISISLAVAKAIPNVFLMALIATMGAYQLAAISATPIPKFATGGMIGGRRHSQGGTMIEAEQGEFVMSRSAVESVGIENLNRMNEGGGGGAITVNISGNLLSQDYVEGELAEGIKEAVRRGTDFGIS